MLYSVVGCHPEASVPELPHAPLGLLFLRRLLLLPSVHEGLEHVSSAAERAIRITLCCTEDGMLNGGQQHMFVPLYGEVSFDISLNFEMEELSHCYDGCYIFI